MAHHEGRAVAAPARSVDTRSQSSRTALAIQSAVSATTAAAVKTKPDHWPPCSTAVHLHLHLLSHNGSTTVSTRHIHCSAAVACDARRTCMLQLQRRTKGNLPNAIAACTGLQLTLTTPDTTACSNQLNSAVTSSMCCMKLYGGSHQSMYWQVYQGSSIGLRCIAVLPCGLDVYLLRARCTAATVVALVKGRQYVLYASARLRMHHGRSLSAWTGLYFLLHHGV
jgi:hypothetical protein